MYSQSLDVFAGVIVLCTAQALLVLVYFHNSSLDVLAGVSVLCTAQASMFLLVSLCYAQPKL